MMRLHARPRRRWWLRASLLGLLALVIISVGWYVYALSPRDSNDSNRQLIVVTEGMSSDQIARLLESKRIIHSQLAFRVYIELQGGKGRLQAGGYRFAASEPVPQIIHELETGKIEAYNLTILPGIRLDQIKQILVDAGFGAGAIDTAYSEHYDLPLFASKPADVNLEGYIFPETYQIDSSTTVDSLLRRTFQQFNDELDQAQLPPKLQAQGLTLHQAIILASIVGKETANPDDQKQVAQVFLKRWRGGMVLGSDPTYHYAAHLLGVEPSVTIDSPYNTRKFPGLPPGAIANFNLSTLEAVANPAPGDYLYFVAGDDGKTYFARTFEEHQQNVQKYCHRLCSDT